MNTLALDIGGANIKAAHSKGGAWSLPFALYRQPDLLSEKLAQLTRDLPAFDRLLITMTAELCDCFQTKQEGVERVLAQVEHFANGREIKVWTTHGFFVSPSDAKTQTIAVAASNWHAQATMLAARFPVGESLLIDSGSTTTDVIWMQNGRPAAKGLTDTSRLASGELVYIGARRTPLMALGPTAELDGKTYGVMNELFADAGDAHLLTGAIAEEPDCCETWDGRPKTREFAAARVARMIGADLHVISYNKALRLADWFAARIMERAATGIERVVSGRTPLRVVVSGEGEFIAVAAARRVLGTVEIVRLSSLIGASASTAACAWALLELDS